MTTYALNEKLNGIEISFSSVPSVDIRNTLKECGFRWHRQKKVWYAKQTETRLKLAESLTTETSTRTTNTKTVNKYGVQVGDIFRSSWGYEQTNLTFFQVISLAGDSSVRVREVNPEIVRVENETHASGDYVYNINREILPPATTSVFIKDQNKGDVKRLKSHRQDNTEPQFRISSFANAYLVKQGENTFFSSSWY